MAARKIFVGSLPDGTDSDTLALEFSKYGSVEDVFVKPNCESGRQWAFITFQSPDQAQLAKDNCDRVLMLPGSTRPCDVMLAKNQGQFGQAPLGGPAPGEAPKKIFVGSLPDGCTEDLVRLEYSKYGMIEEVFLKSGCAPGKQWCFVTFSLPDEAQSAVVGTNGTLVLPGGLKPCEVKLARNQGMFGQGSMNDGGGGQHPGAHQAGGGQIVYPPGPGSVAPYGGQHAEPPPRKIFVGSLPDGIDDSTLRTEFSRFGEVGEIFIKQNCEPGRQWAFITFATPDQAAYAKHTCDNVLMLPGSVKPSEVTFAKNQGLFGQDSLGEKQGKGGCKGGGKGGGKGQFGGGGCYGGKGGQYGAAPAHGAQSQYAMQAQQELMVEGPKKIFVGSLPDDISDQMLRAEFSKFGQVIDVFLKTGCAPGRQWSFVTFASPDQAVYAKESTDRVLMFPSSISPCEVMLAKNQGKFGQAPLQGGGPPPPPQPQHHQHYPQQPPQPPQPQHYPQPPQYAPQRHVARPPAGVNVPPPAGVNVPPPPVPQAGVQPGSRQGGGGVVPPPPSAPPPAHLTSWRQYKTAGGLPYYHNSTTGVTTWECPPELQAGGRAAPY